MPYPVANASGSPYTVPASSPPELRHAPPPRIALCACSASPSPRPMSRPSSTCGPAPSPGRRATSAPRRRPRPKPGQRQVKRLTNVSKPTLTVFRPAKDKDTGAAVVIAPGGGYNILAWDLEGEEVAAWLNTIGVTGIVLKYRVPRRPGEPTDKPPIGAEAGRPAGNQPRPQPGEGVGHRPEPRRDARLLGRRAPHRLDRHQLRPALLRADRRHRQGELPAGLRGPRLPGLPRREGQAGPTLRRHPRVEGHAAVLLRPRLRRRRLAGEQRADVPGAEEAQGAGRAARLLDRRPRVRPPPGGQACARPGRGGARSG